MLPDWLSHYVGIPYATGGRDRATGLDCWGLVCLVWQERFALPEPPWAAPAWAGKADNLAVAGFIEKERGRAYDAVEAGQERLGDAVLIRMRGHPLHVGLVVARGQMLHTHERTMSCIDTYTGLEWSKRVLGFYRPHAHA